MIESPFAHRSVVWDAPRLKAEIAELELELELLERHQQEPEQRWRRRLYQCKIANRLSMLRCLEGLKAAIPAMGGTTTMQAKPAGALKAM